MGDDHGFKVVDVECGFINGRVIVTYEEMNLGIDEA